MQAKKRKYTAAFRLFHFRYEMMIPQMFFYGREYLRKHGYHVTGDYLTDQERLMEPMRVRQTPAALAMFHAEGCLVNIVNPRDSVVIYDDIREHLMDWERQVIQGIHPNDVPPIEDFRKLEAIAIELYRLAKFYEPQDRRGDTLRDQLMEMNRRRNPARTEQILRRKLLNEDGELKPYISIVDRIERELFGEY